MKDLDFIDQLMDEDDYKLLHKRCNRMKIDVLMEEPCPLYEPDEND
jgi:hypothetical protein